MNYPYNVPSVTQIHPGLANNPNIFNVQAFQGVHASKAIRTPVDPLAVIDAEGTVEVLSASKRTLPGVITDPIIETAKNCAHVLRETHASLEFGLQPGIGVFVQQQFINFGQQLFNFGRGLAQMEARNANTCILSHNRRYISDPLRPLQKYTDGDGHNLALTICGQAALPAAAQNFQPNAAVGDIPNPWNPNIDAYQHLDILQLVIFYNDDFGIIAGDPVATRRYKVRTWLVEQE